MHTPDTLQALPAPRNPNRGTPPVLTLYGPEPMGAAGLIPLADVFNSETAARLVACWNVCSGVDTATLQAMGAGAMNRNRDRWHAERMAALAVSTAARALLDAFGGDTPDWLTGEALALSTALESAKNVSEGREPIKAEPAAPAGPFYVTLDHEKSADECATLEAARASGRAILAREPFACTVSIYTEAGDCIKDIGSTAGKGKFRLADAPVVGAR